MSWCGRRGRGFASGAFEGHERVVIAVSLNKAFGAGGGALVFPEARLRQKILNCGSPMIFTGPIQPPVLGAAVASARLHLSPEIDRLQAALLARIRFANQAARALDLPLASCSQFSIRGTHRGRGLAVCRPPSRAAVHIHPTNRIPSAIPIPIPPAPKPNRIRRRPTPPPARVVPRGVIAQPRLLIPLHPRVAIPPRRNLHARVHRPIRRSAIRVILLVEDHVPGIAVADSQRVDWWSTADKLRPLDANVAYAIAKGRKLLRSFNG